jgi:hypothetical protein
MDEPLMESPMDAPTEFSMDSIMEDISTPSMGSTKLPEVEYEPLMEEKDTTEGTSMESYLEEFMNEPDQDPSTDMLMDPPMEESTPESDGFSIDDESPSTDTLDFDALQLEEISTDSPNTLDSDPFDLADSKDLFDRPSPFDDEKKAPDNEAKAKNSKSAALEW